MANRVAVFRKEHFNAAHRLYNPQWNDEQNNAMFGKCSLPHYHGHNYEIEIKVVGEPDPVTCFLMDMKKLSGLVNEKVIERFDHKNLNMDTEEFKSVNPTAENIAIVIFNLLRPHINSDLDLYIRLYETPRNFVEYPVA
jgi:6-pyruvoyltetrahydropterin/6-carboxytetrahydropterin synthase